MDKKFKYIIDIVEPINDSIRGRLYRCSLTLKDGTLLPCAIIHSKQKLVDLAKKRIAEELGGKGIIRGADPYDQIISTFVASGNRVNDYDVSSASYSKYAIPLSLLSKIESETTMGWTGWVFEMNDGKLFSYGTSFAMEFFQLPDGYGFEDVQKVHNHSYLDSTGAISPLRRGASLNENYVTSSILRERVYFNCAIDGI